MIRHVLVPVDFSDTSRAAAKYAVELCQVHDARMTMLYVVYADRLEAELLGLDAYEYLSAARESAADAANAPWRRAALERLDAFIDPDWKSRVKIDRDCEIGRPSLMIVDYAKRHACDLIVMGTHGRGPVAHFFLGSVAENVLRSAACPVLTVRNH